MSPNEHGRSVQVRQYSERSVRFAFPRIPIEQARIRESPSSLSGKGLGSVSVKLAGLGDVLVRLRRHFWPFQEQLYRNLPPAAFAGSGVMLRQPFSSTRTFQ